MTLRRLGAAASLLLVATIAVQACRQAGPATGQAAFKPVASVDQIMDGIIIPSSQAIFDAVVYSNGELVQAPKSDDQWHALQMHALAVAEAGNLLMMPPRAKDAGDWMKMAADLNDRAVRAAQAAETKDLDGLLSAGSEMYESCTACHEKYIPSE